MFEVVPKRIYVKNKDANGLFNDMGGKETFKKYEPIEEPVFFKNEEEPEKKEYTKVTEPLYTKPGDEEEEPEKTPEDKQFQEVKRPVYKPKENVPKDEKDEDKKYDIIEVPIYRKVTKKLGDAWRNSSVSKRLDGITGYDLSRFAQMVPM